jgi:hypothetical protein
MRKIKIFPNMNSNILNKTDTLETLVKEILDSFKFTKSKERKQK